MPILAFLIACGTGPAATAPADTRPFDYDSKAPLDTRVVSTESRDGLTIQEIEYASPRGGRVPATVMIPAGKGPFAGILLMHGAPGSRRQTFKEAEELARAGAVTLSIDAPFARQGRPAGEILRFDEQDREDSIQLIVDLRRGVDVLLARSDVDPKRLGYVGGSYGGAMGGLLAGVEKRIKAYALFVGDGGLVSHFTGADDTNGPLQQMPKDRADRWLAAMLPIEPIHFVGRAAPAHLLFQNGRQDTMVPPADGRAFQEAGSEPKTIQWYDSGHKLPDEARAARRLWLAERLGLKG
ncbi:MAG TPA: prolyl oligopeptidase family serine peptidase [Thermoanaerobaculia bacterium]|nr:prolyl oligopeptidase family serine peptidase [Thermoanaerobaculia bacterium]